LDNTISITVIWKIPYYRDNLVKQQKEEGGPKVILVEVQPAEVIGEAPSVG